MESHLPRRTPSSGLIFVSLEDWDDVWRRNQFLCTGLARRCYGVPLLFVGLARDVSHSLRRGKIRALLQPALRQVPDTPNITVMQPLKLLPNSWAWGRRFNEWHQRAQVRREAARLGMARPLLWLNPHQAVHMVGKMGEQAVVYDITDDWISPTQSARQRALTVAQDAELCRRADAVVVCSPHLYAMKQGFTRALHLIPNGVDAAHYLAASASGSLPPAVRDWQKPVFGYTGTIHPDRVDVTLVEALARAFPSGTVALVGPNLLPPSETSRLEARGNIYFTGPVPYADVPQYMAAFDVCITPHRMTPFTESLNPIKLWEYLACGKPIVSTNVAGFRDYPQFVRLASDAAGFVDACRTALAEGNVNTEARQAEARANSWEARVESVLAVLNNLPAHLNV